jgi:hypothetical protein
MRCSHKPPVANPGYNGDFPNDRLDASLRWHDGLGRDLAGSARTAERQNSVRITKHIVVQKRRETFHSVV